MKRLGVSVFLAAAAAIAACASEDGGATMRRGTSPEENAKAADAGPTTDVYNAAQVRSYLRQLSPMFISRELDQSELAEIEDKRFDAVTPMLEKWSKSLGFPRSARRLYSEKLSVSGTRDGIDFDLPGNLAEYIVKENLPLTTILTADFCVDAAGQKRDCDTAAPFKAGVLGTRAYLASRASRFNLTRASTMMHTFACVGYPMPEQMEPRIDRARLIAMFSTDTEVDDQGKPKATFGNGAACYNCHGQFGPHAQLFVRFDATGNYKADATGIQDPKGELGRSLNGLMASHLKDPTEAKVDTSQMLGKPVKDLQEAAAVLAKDPGFLPCQAKNVIGYALRLAPDATIDHSVLEEIARSAAEDGEATFGKLVVAAFSHPRVAASVISGLDPAKPAAEAAPQEKP